MMRYGGVWAATAATVVLGGLTTGCASKGTTNPDTAVITAGSVSVLMETEGYGGDVGGVGVFGRIGIVGGECVGFVGHGTPKRLIVFPPGTTVTGHTPRDLVIHIGKVDLRIGEEVEGGTRLNGHARTDLSHLGDLSTQAPKACRKFPALPVGGFKRAEKTIRVP